MSNAEVGCGWLETQDSIRRYYSGDNASVALALHFVIMYTLSTAVKGAASTAIRLASSAAAAQAWSAPLAARSLATVASAGGVGKRRGRRVFVVGVGMTKFEKPGRREQFDYPDMVREGEMNPWRRCCDTLVFVMVMVVLFAGPRGRHQGP